MNQTVKVILYVVFLVCGLAFAYAVKVNLSGGADPTPGAPRPTRSATNNVRDTNDAPETNAAAAANLPGATNAATGETNATPGTNPPAAGRPQAAADSDPDALVRPRGRAVGRAVAFGGGAFVCLVGLSLLLARDFTRFVAQRFERFVFNEDLVGVKDPAYEEAEKAWTNGDYLQAVQLMRDYYQKHPSEVYVALRIAEIYENDLKNHVASALEYEEILKKRLPPDRWGWAAIHLANLYSGRLNKPHEATKLLHRIVDEFGQTPAAKKARQRLGIPEPIEEIELEAEPTPAAASVKVVTKLDAATPSEMAPEPPKPSLPPGFRPKKG